MEESQGAESKRGFLARHAGLSALGGYLLLAGIFYAPLLLGVRTFADGDFIHHFLPFSLFQQAAIKALEAPLWNPYTYSGHPFLADIQAAVYYPVSNALLLISLPWRGDAARLYWLQVEAILQVALAGFFVWLLVRELTGKAWAAFLAGAIFAFSGYLTGYPPVQLAVLRSAIWLPLLFWLLWRGFANPREMGWWMGAAAAYAVAFLGGHPQTVLHLSYAVAAWALVLLAAGWQNPGFSEKPGFLEKLGFFAPGLLTFALLALALLAAQLLPSLEFSRLSVRANVDYAFVSGGFPLRDTWQMLLPGVFTYYSPLYVGVVGLAAAAAALAGLFIRSRGDAPAEPDRPLSPRGAVLFFAILGLIALLLSYGGNGFLYPLFYRIAPGWKLFRGQERAAYLVAFALSILAGLGAAGLPAMGERLRRRTALLYGGLITIGVYAFGLYYQLPGQTVMGQWRYLLLAALTLILAMAAALILWLPGWSRRREWLFIGLAAANLFAAGFGTNFAARTPAEAVRLAPEMEALGAAVQERSDANLGLPGRVYNEFRIYEDYGMRQQIEDVWGASPLRLAAYAALFDQFPLDRMWRLTGVEHVLTWRQELFEPSQLIGAFPQQTDTTYLHRLDGFNPRAWLVSEVRVADDAAARDLLADHEFDLERVGLLPVDLTTDEGPTTNDGRPTTKDERRTTNDERSAADEGEASLVIGRSSFVLRRPSLERLAANRLKVNVAEGPGGLLIISENWMPGWRVENPVCGGDPDCAGAAPPLDSLPLLQPVRADLTLIGVPIPAGQVSFELVYDPASVRIGFGISLIALLLILVYAGWRYLLDRSGTAVQEVRLLSKAGLLRRRAWAGFAIRRGRA